MPFWTKDKITVSERSVEDLGKQITKQIELGEKLKKSPPKNDGGKKLAEMESTLQRMRGELDKAKSEADAIKEEEVPKVKDLAQRKEALGKKADEMKGRIDAFLPPKEEPKQDDKDAAAAEAASEEKATDGEPDDGQKAKKKQDKKEADGQEDKGQGEDEEDEDEPGEEEEEEEEEDDDDDEPPLPRPKPIARKAPAEKAKAVSKQAEQEEVPKHEEDEDEDEEEAEEEEVEEEEEEEVEEEEVEEEEVEEEEEAEVDDEAEEDEEEDDDEEAAVDDKEEHGSAEESLVGGEHEEEGPQLFYAIENCQGEGEEELSFQKGDVLTIVDRGRGVKDWWRARDKAGNVGWVPSTHLKKCPPTSTRDRWRKAFKKVSGRRQTVRGFTLSYLAGISQESNGHCLLENALRPRLSKSNLTFRDLPPSGEVAAGAASTGFLRLVTLQQCRDVVLSGETKDVNPQIKARFVRVCVFDGKQVLSNIHVVKALPLAEAARDQTWRFSPKLDATNGSDKLAEMVVKMRPHGANLGLLFEVCVIATIEKEEHEVSCGSHFLMLFDETGAEIPSALKKSNLPLQQHSPFHAAPPQSPGKASFRELMGIIRGPCLSIRMRLPRDEQKELLSQLPSTLVLPSCHGQAVSFYRKELSLGLRGQGRFCSEQMFSPFVATFPQAVSQCDLMDVLVEEWSKLQASREFRSQKRTDDEVRRRFIALFADVVYPTLQVHNLPPYSLFGDNTRRSQVLLKHRARLATGSGHALLLDADLRFRPIDVHQFALDLLGPLR